MASEPFPSLIGAPALGYANTAAIVPNDAADLSFTTRALYVGGAGNVNLVDANGTNTLFSGVTAGTVLPVRISRVKATNTTATNLVALW